MCYITSLEIEPIRLQEVNQAEEDDFFYVDGVDFQQGLPDLDNLDPRDKHLISLDDLMDGMNQRVASLFTKKSHQ